MFCSRGPLLVEPTNPVSITAGNSVEMSVNKMFAYRAIPNYYHEFQKVLGCHGGGEKSDLREQLPSRIHSKYQIGVTPEQTVRVAAVFSSGSLSFSSLDLSDISVYEPYLRALLGTALQFCEVIFLKSRTVPNGTTLSSRIRRVIRHSQVNGACCGSAPTATHYLPRNNSNLVSDNSYLIGI